MGTMKRKFDSYVFFQYFHSFNTFIAVTDSNRHLTWQKTSKNIAAMSACAICVFWVASGKRQPRHFRFESICVLFDLYLNANDRRVRSC